MNQVDLDERRSPVCMTGEFFLAKRDEWFVYGGMLYMINSKGAKTDSRQAIFSADRFDLSNRRTVGSPWKKSKTALPLLTT